MIPFLSSALGLSALGARLAATGGIVAAVLAAWLGFAWHYESKGAAKEVAKIEKDTTHATTVIRNAAAKSADSGVRGVRDPSTKND